LKEFASAESGGSVVSSGRLADDDVNDDVNCAIGPLLLLFGMR
jgi:hypothetical protein